MFLKHEVFMKKGDLVQLSSYGKKLNCLAGYTEQVGIIMSDLTFGSAMVMWTSGFCRMNRRDIKKVKSQKK